MSNERLGKIKFSSSDGTVYFCKAKEDSSGLLKNADDEVFMSCVAEKLGKPGGQGTAYKVAGGPFPAPIVLKIYKNKLMSENGVAIGGYLRGLISFGNKATIEIKTAIDRDTIWPKMLVYDYHSGNVIGFAMNLIPSAFYSKMITRYGEEKTKESNLDFILHGDNFRLDNKLPVITNTGREKIIYDFIKIVHLLHSNDYVLGDLSPKNTLIYVDSDDQRKNKVLLIDTDSYRKKGSANPFKQAHTPNWIPPECVKAKIELRNLTPNTNPHKIERLKTGMFIQNQCTDMWKLCISVLRLYHHEENSASITMSQLAEDKLRKEIGNEFLLYIKRGLSENPDDRPVVADLLDCLKKSLLSKRKK